MIFCNECGKPNTVFKNAFGEILCEECWDEYINSDRGKVEHFINIVMGEEDLAAFDADHLGNIVNSWTTHKSLLNLTEKEIKTYEDIASLMCLI